MTAVDDPLVDDGAPASIAPRDLVPTRRELDEGGEQRDYTFADRNVEPPEKPPLKARVGRLLGDLDPRLIEGPKSPLVIIALGSLFAGWDDVAIGVLLPEMRADFGFSLVFLTTLATMLQYAKVLTAPFFGYLADRVTRVWMVRVAGILGNVGSILTGAAGGISGLVLGRSVTGLGQAVGEPAGFPLLTDYYPSHVRARVFAFLGAMGTLGAMIGPTVAGRLGEWFGWRTAVVSLGILALVTTVGSFFLREPVRGYWDRKEMGADEGVASLEAPPIGWAEAWRAAWSIQTLRRLWFATPFFIVSGTGLGLFVGLYFAQEFGLTPSQRGYLATLNGGVALLGLLFAGPVADRLLAVKPGRVFAAFGALAILQSLSVLLLVRSGNLALSIVAGLPLGFGMAAMTPALVAVYSLVIPARMRGLGLQAGFPFVLMGLSIVPFIGQLADSWGLRRAMLAFIPVLILGAIIMSTAGFGVERDMRAAKAASMADEAVRRARAGGRAKMVVCRDVDVHYGGTQVLFNVDFDVDEGELVALLGTNGAGKSTLLRAIAGTQEASNGAIFFDGQDITHAPPHQNAQRGIVMVPGGRAVFPTLTVEENLRTAAWMHRGDDDLVRTGIEEVLDFFPILRERLAQPAGNLSGGEQQMVALGQAFLMKPRLLMIDELSLGLAPAIVEQLLATLRRINDEGTTIVIVEQSLNVAVSIARRAVFMEKGEVRFDGPTAELLEKPELIRAVFMGGGGTGAPAVTARRRSTTDERETLLRVEDLTVSFGGVHAVSGASLELAAGEIVGVIGPNGAGKSTVFDLITGYLRPDAGAVHFDGVDVTDESPDARARRGLTRSFQNTTLFPSMTVRDNIAVALDRHLKAKGALAAAVWSPKLRRSERRTYERVDGLIALLNLQAYRDRFVDELSTGTRRAVDIACVMAAEPTALLLDEPSSGLAQAESEAMGPLLQRLVRETGAGLLVIEHDLPLIASIADRLVAMELGRVVTSGPPHDVLTDERVTGSYLAASDVTLGRSDSKALGDLLGRNDA